MSAGLSVCFESLQNLFRWSSVFCEWLWANLHDCGRRFVETCDITVTARTNLASRAFDEPMTKRRSGQRPS